MMEFKLWSRRQRKRSERNAHRIVGRANLNRCLTSKDLQEDLAESGVVEHCSAVQQHLHIYDLHGRVIWKKKTNLKVSSPQNSESEVFKWTSKQAWCILETSPVDWWQLLGHIEQRYPWRKTVAEFHEQNMSPTVKINHVLGLCVEASGRGDISLVEGGIHSIQYKQILVANTTPSTV